MRLNEFVCHTVYDIRNYYNRCLYIIGSFSKTLIVHSCRQKQFKTFHFPVNDQPFYIYVYIIYIIKYSMVVFIFSSIQ